MKNVNRELARLAELRILDNPLNMERATSIIVMFNAGRLSEKNAIDNLRFIK